MAKKTELPKNKGGSPTPFELWMVRKCAVLASFAFRKEMLNSRGVSKAAGIL